MDASEVARIGHCLWLLVERRIEDGAILGEHKRDWHQAAPSRPAASVARTARRAALEQLELAPGQRRHAAFYSSAISTVLIVTGAVGRSCAPVWAVAILSSVSSPPVSLPKIV